MANSVDPPDQAAPAGAVWSGSRLFAQTCLSENLESLLYALHWAITLCFYQDVSMIYSRFFNKCIGYNMKYFFLMIKKLFKNVILQILNFILIS